MDAERATGATRDGVEEARDAFSDRIADVRDQIKVRTDKAVETGRHLYGRAADHAQGLAGNVDAMIDDQPYVALAVAAVAGVVVGLILGMSLNGRE